MKYKLPLLPKPDTHCFDEDTGKDVWSHSLDQMQAYAIAAIEAQGVPDANAEFNRAIDFAIEQGIEAAVFLRCWREGDTSEWPEFTPMLASAPPAPKAEKRLTGFVLPTHFDVLTGAGIPDPTTFGSGPQAKQCEWTNCPTRVGDKCCNEQADVVQQEPVGKLCSDEFDGHVFVPRIPGDWSMLGKDLYTHPAPQAKPQPLSDPLHDDIHSVLFEVEQAIKNGCCPWQIEAAFEAYEAARRLQQPAHGITKE